MTKLGTKWVRNDQTGYEMTKMKIKVGTKWPKWYEMTWVRNDLGTKWPVTLNYNYNWSYLSSGSRVSINPWPPSEAWWIFEGPTFQSLFRYQLQTIRQGLLETASLVLIRKGGIITLSKLPAILIEPLETTGNKAKKNIYVCFRFPDPT